MKVDQPYPIGNVIPFQMRSKDSTERTDETSGDNIIRLLDLSKFEKTRPTVDNYNANMRANIAALVLLGLLVFVAKEDFSKIEQANLCAVRSECFN
jgi:hypothetical protein